MMRAGQAVVESLLAEDVEIVFGLVGHTINGILTEMYGREDIRFIDNRHEEGAAFMAYGYAQASGRPAVCMTTAGPAATNLATGIALAFKGNAPVVAITGDVNSTFANRDGFQSLDLVDLFKPITKLSVQVNQSQRIPEMVRQSFRTALSGRRGPVFLDIPQDLLEAQELDVNILQPAAYRVVASRIGGDQALIQQAASILSSAKRPVLLVGGGVICSEATQETLKLAEYLNMALIASYGHHDAVPNSHPLYVGPLGMRGSPEAEEIVQQADVILALGSRLNQLTTGWDNHAIAPNSQIIQVDIQPEEIGNNYPISAGIIGDAKVVASQIFDALKSHSPNLDLNNQWRISIQDAAERRQNRLAEEATLTGEPMMPHRVYSELVKVLPQNCMVTIDAGVTAGLSYDRLKFEEPRTMFNYSQQGGLGMGLAVSLGTKLGRPDRPAISIQGDGGFLYASQELNTAVRHKIPVVSIVLNNNCQGAEKLIQTRQFNNRYIGVDLINPRFDKLAEVYGAKGFYVEQPEDIVNVVKEALALNQPSVIEIPVAQDFLPA